MLWGLPIRKIPPLHLQALLQTGLAVTLYGAAGIWYLHPMNTNSQGGAKPLHTTADYPLDSFRFPPSGATVFPTHYGFECNARGAMAELGCTRPQLPRSFEEVQIGGRKVVNMDGRTYAIHNR